MNRPRIQLPNGSPVIPHDIAPAPAMMIASPLNDTQLVTLLAAHRPEMPLAESVAWAIEIVAEAVSQQPKLGAAIRTAQEKAKANA